MINQAGGVMNREASPSVVPIALSEATLGGDPVRGRRIVLSDMLAKLKRLEKGRSWRVYEVRDFITEGDLRVMDLEGLVEFCRFGLNPLEHAEPLKPGWFSFTHAAPGSLLGSLTGFLEENGARDDLVPAIRVTEKGRAVLEEQGRRKNEPGKEQDRRKSEPGDRMKREVAHPLIAEHLMARPHDTAQQVADTVSCSVGVVAESPAWKLNQKRLRIAKASGTDPKAIRLDERAINAAGGGRMAQLRDHKQQTDAVDEKLDQRARERERELFRQIGEYQKTHPGASTETVAAKLGCTAGDVERRQARLDDLAFEQENDHKEDIDLDDPDTRRGSRRKWAKKKA